VKCLQAVLKGCQEKRFKLHLIDIEFKGDGHVFSFKKSLTSAANKLQFNVMLSCSPSFPRAIPACSVLVAGTVQCSSLAQCHVYHWNFSVLFNCLFDVSFCSVQSSFCIFSYRS